MPTVFGTSRSGIRNSKVRLLPLAARFLLSAAWRAGWVPLPGNAARWFMAGLAVAIAASYPLPRGTRPGSAPSPSG